MRLVLLVLLLLGPLPVARAQDPSDADPVTTGGGGSLGAPSPPASSRASEDEPQEMQLHVPALLDARTGEARSGRGGLFAAWGSIGIFSGTIAPEIVSAATTLRGGDATILAPSVGVRLALTDELDASVEWVLAYGLTTVRGDYDGATDSEAFEGQRERVEAGNPTLLVGWSHAWSSLVLQVGVGAALPIAALAQAASDTNTAMDRASSVLIHEAMLAMHGGIDPWRFLPERLSFFVPVRITMGDRLGGSVEVAGGWTIPVLGSASGSSSEAAIQVAGDISYEIIPELRIGARGSIVAWRLGSHVSPDRTLVALEPWIRATFGPAFLTARATLDVGGDYGLGGASGVWAIHIGGGAVFER